MAQSNFAPSPPESAPIPTLIDNRPGKKLLDVIGRLMRKAHTVDIATGYFEVGALVDLDQTWQQLSSMRLLMGDEVTRTTKQHLVEALASKGDNGIERIKEADDWRALEGLESVKAAIQSKAIEARVYTKAKFHAKAYHFYTGGVVNHGLLGSSNFTHPGLTQNLELNLFTSDPSQLDKLAAWYQQAWDEAEDLSEDLLKIIQPHIVQYFPFQIYLQAMRERFFGLEPEQEGWEQTQSQIYPLLAKYQQDAYHDLLHMARQWGGGLLCDGVGLGKTYVALMLVERALADRHKVLVVAPKATIPSVWAKNLARFFPDDFGRFTDDIRVIAHTDLGREGGITNEEIDKLRKRYETIIVDEAHHFRVPNRNRSKKLKVLAKDRRLFLLTATPVNNSVVDLYNLVNFIAQDRKKHFQSVNVPDLRAWFTKMQGERETNQFELGFTDLPEFQDFLKNVIVQRSRGYVKSLDKQEDKSVKFPVRQKPEVVKYSLSTVYGPLLPKLIKAFDKGKGDLKLVIYETEKFKAENARDGQTLLQQSQVVGLIRTMLLKRLESSQKSLEASIEDLLLKHIALLQLVHKFKHDFWLSLNEDVYKVIQKHRVERFGEGSDDEEEDELPLTSYEGKKLAQMTSEIKLFGANENTWIESLEKDTQVLTDLLRGLHEVTKPEHDDKLLAFIRCIRETPRLQKDKFVVFSEFKDTARYLEEQLKLHFPKEAIVEVDSGRNVRNREDVIKRFAPHYNCESAEDSAKALKDPIRILISTDVLSEGLNLQDANIIVNYDLHWNPVRLMQRIGRVDRRMDPGKPVQYDKVYVYNFLPPDDLKPVLKLYETITGKLIAINRTLGIEAPVLTAEDDFKAMDFYQNLGEATMSVAEHLRLKAHQLAQDHPELWNATSKFPNRIYSGKAPVNDQAPARGTPHPAPGAPSVFLAYRVPTGQDAETGEPAYDVKWFLIDRETEEITQDLATIHAAIECGGATPRKVDTPPAERDKLRKKVEDEEVQRILFRSGLPASHKAELICWMEIG